MLLVDLDPQGNASLVLTGGDPSPRGPCLGDVLLGSESPVSAVRPSTVQGVELLPAGVGLADAAVRLGGEIGRERRLRLALGELVDRFDVCLIDCPPGMGPLLVNGLNAADGVLVPVDPGLFCLSGLAALLDAVRDVGRFLDARGLSVRRMVLSRVRRDRVSADVCLQLRERFGDLVARAELPASVKVEEAHGRFLPVPIWSPRCAVSVSLSDLVEEIFACQPSRRVA